MPLSYSQRKIFAALVFDGHLWPKSRNLATPRIAESLTRLVIAARGEFPSALAEVQDWLQPIEHPNYAVSLLSKSGLCGKFPTEGLRLLSSVIADQQWVPSRLNQCLEEIVQADPNLAQDPSYMRLRDYSRRSSM